MKSWQVLVLSTAIGLVVGFGVTAVERSGKHELFLPAQYEAVAAQNELAEKQKKQQISRSLAKFSGPALELLDGTDYDFGSMERSSRRRHVFRIKSVGEQKLTIMTGHTTCKCTVSAALSVTAPGSTAWIE